jgi:hypothetical protein
MGSGGQRSMALRTKQSPMGILFNVERKKFSTARREEEKAESSKYLLLRSFEDLISGKIFSNQL